MKTTKTDDSRKAWEKDVQTIKVDPLKKKRKAYSAAAAPALPGNRAMSKVL